MGPEHDDLSRSTGPLISFLNLGISVVGTNLLYHRQLLQKAKVMVKMSASILRIKLPFFAAPIHLSNVPRKSRPIEPTCAFCFVSCTCYRIDKVDDPSVRWLAMLEGSFIKWEARTLYTIAVAIVVGRVSPAAWAIFTAVSFILIVVMDTTFSAMITTIFLLPILEVLGEGKGAAQHSAGYKKMQQTKWMTMFGASFSVLSSTLLHVGFLLAIFGGFGSQCDRSPWLNPFVFGISMDSICDDVGVIFACGVLKKAPSLSVTTIYSASGAQHNPWWSGGAVQRKRCPPSVAQSTLLHLNFGALEILIFIYSHQHPTCCIYAGCFTKFALPAQVP